jgi:hypothetical protein
LLPPLEELEELDPLELLERAMVRLTEGFHRVFSSSLYDDIHHQQNATCGNVHLMVATVILNHRQ